MTHSAIRKRYGRAINAIMKKGKTEKGARRELAKHSTDPGVGAHARDISRTHARSLGDPYVHGPEAFYCSIDQCDEEAVGFARVDGDLFYFCEEHEV
jgi:hypothetical protein